LLLAQIVDKGKHISEGLFSTLMLMNPADAYRLLNFTGFEVTGQLVGVSHVEINWFWPLVSMGVWLVVPFIMTTAMFHKREL
jgi:Cu-processing system permease protein